MPPASLGDRFIAAFNKIDQYLKAESDASSYKDRVWASTAPVIVERRRDVEGFANVRNLIVHRFGNRMYEVEPSAWLVGEIEQIAEVLTRPPTVDEVLGPRHVETCAPAANAIAVARLMLMHDYSQVPVYEDGRFRTVLTFETLARWMTARLDDVGLLEPEAVDRVLQSAEVEPVVVFQKRIATVPEVLAMFTEHSRKGVFVSAVILSEYASKTNPPTNIVVAADLPVLRGSRATLGAASPGGPAWTRTTTSGGSRRMTSSPAPGAP